jgi:hypothetical protein
MLATWLIGRIAIFFKEKENENQHDFRMRFCCLVLCSLVHYFNSGIEEYNPGFYIGGFIPL